MSRLRAALLRFSLAALACGIVVGCGDAPRPAPAPGAKALAGESSAPPAADAPRAAARAVPADAPVVVFLGDSLTAGFGLEESQAFPAVVGELLADRGLPIRGVNGGVSGDTSAGALARIDWLLTQKPEIVVVSIGGNDGLRGQPVEALEANLRAIVRRAKASGRGC